MYNLPLFAVNSTFFTFYSIFQKYFGDLFFVNPPFFLYPLIINNFFPQPLSFYPPPLKILSLPPKIFPPPIMFYLPPLSVSRSLTGPKKGGCNTKKVGVVNTQNTPGFDTPALRALPSCYQLVLELILRNPRNNIEDVHI